jgi:hypothetical protein
MDLDSSADTDAFPLRDMKERDGEPLVDTDTDDVRDAGGLREEVRVRAPVDETKALRDMLPVTVGEFEKAAQLLGDADTEPDGVAETL